MKRIFLLISLYLLLCNAVPAQNNSPIPDSLQKIFSDDSYYIAYNYIRSDSNSRFYNDIKIPEKLKNRIYDALVNIYSRKYNENIDSIYNIYKLYGVKTEVLNSIYMHSDTSIEWVKNIINRNDRSGNTVIDNLISEYKGNIVIDKPQFGYQDFLIYFNFEIPVNVDALLKKLASQGITNLSRQYLLGGPGNEIFYRSLNYGDNEITYFLRWGDCPSGCINYHKWIVNVSEFGKIKDVKSSGDEIPEDYLTH